MIDMKHILLINKIDKVLETGIEYYYQCIIIKELIKNWREKEVEEE